MSLTIRLAIAAVAASLACARPGAAPIMPVPALITEASSTPPALAVEAVQQSAPAPEAADTVTVAEVDRRASEIFGSSLPDSASAPTDSGDDAGLEPTWDIDVRSYETTERVRFYLERFSGSSRARIADRLSEGTRYETMIRTRLRAGGLPEDMYYLALVESGFNPHAYSRAAAVGMWQFMTTTARGMGLRVDWWVDERRDPIRSTEAAVRFLKGLNEQFGSMYLAAAAYNGGPGRIARGLSRYEDDLEGVEGDDMFFALADKKYLKNETREYVPQLIAVALVAKEAERYGIVIENRAVFEYDSVVVGPLVGLPAVANAAGVPVASLVELNSHLLRGLTPPRMSSKVRVPVGTRARVDSVLPMMSVDELRGARVMTTKKAATWATLARAEKISAKTLSAFNPKTKANRKTGLVAAGTQLLVPTPAVAAVALSVPDPAIERYGSSSRSHVVRKGENLSIIAKRYKTTTASIMRLNRLKKAMIFPGQELRVR
jgi:membrane-bound lytic murein transglycosylase D